MENVTNNLAQIYTQIKFIIESVIIISTHFERLSSHEESFFCHHLASIHPLAVISTNPAQLRVDDPVHGILHG